jgi:hypothetical protein
MARAARRKTAGVLHQEGRPFIQPHYLSISLADPVLEQGGLMIMDRLPGHLSRPRPAAAAPEPTLFSSRFVYH